jgi:hypothetical protein
MAPEKPAVEILGYMGGQDEDLGGYLEPMIIRVGGRENYILHLMIQYRDESDINEKTGFPKINPEHKKIEFGKLEELTEAFKSAESRLGIDKSLGWKITDSTCGYGVPLAEFIDARIRLLQKPVRHQES